MATAFYVVKNNTGSTISAPHATGSGTLTLADASGFPTTYPFRLSTFASDGTPKSILSITNRTGNVLTVGGAIEGTTDVSLSIGDLARLRVTAGALQDVHTAVNTLETTTAGYGDVVTHAASDFATASALTTHTGNTSNPHSVTAAQVGSYTTAQTDTLLSGKQASGSYVLETRTVAGHALSSNVTITPSDIGAQASGTYVSGTLVTSVGNPGADTNIPSEAAVRSAISGSGGGTVSSVGLSMPTGFSVSGSPVTTTGTLAVTTALSGYVKAGAGSFTAGSIAAGDIPDISATYKTVSSLATWTGSTAITTLGTIATGTWQGSVVGPAYVGTGARDGTKYLRDDGAWTAVAGGSAYDMYSPLVSAEISITGATTLTISRLHVVSGASDYTITLPSVSGNTGKMLGIRVASSATSFFTVDAGTGVTIDGLQTRLMWAGETATLLCDGTNWNKVSGRSIAMSSAQGITSGATITAVAGVYTKMPCNVARYDYGSLVDGTNSRAIVRRAGLYLVSGYVMWKDDINNQYNIVIIYKNGSEVGRAGITDAMTAASYPAPMVSLPVVAGAGDNIELWVNSANACDIYAGYPQGSETCWFSVTEIPRW